MDVNRIIHGDALDVLRGMPDASVDMIFTDPPCGFWRQIDVYYFPDAWYTCTCTFPYNTDEPGVCAHRPALSAIEEMTHMPHPFNSTTTPNHTQSHTAAFREAVPS